MAKLSCSWDTLSNCNWIKASTAHSIFHCFLRRCHSISTRVKDAALKTQCTWKSMAAAHLHLPFQKGKNYMYHVEEEPWNFSAPSEYKAQTVFPRIMIHRVNHNRRIFMIVSPLLTRRYIYIKTTSRVRKYLAKRQLMQKVCSISWQTWLWNKIETNLVA